MSVSSVANDEAGVLTWNADLRNQLDIEVARCRGGYIDELPPEVYDSEGWYLQKKCCTADTEVLTLERGALQIPYVRRGMHVLSRDGKYHEVLGTARRRLCRKESLISIRPWGARRFSVTADHRVLVQKGGRLTWVQAQEIEKGDWLFVPTPRAFEVPVPVSEVVGTRYQFFKFESLGGYGKEVPRTSDFFRFLGFWLGDGTSAVKAQAKNKTTNRMGVAVTDKGRKGRLWNRIYHPIARDVLHISRFIIDRDEQRKLRAVLWTDGPVVNWLNSNFRAYKAGGGWKRLPEWFDSLSDSEFRAFLRGWWDADGWGVPPEARSGETQISTVSRMLASDAYRQCLMRGIPCSVYRSSVRYKGKPHTYFVIKLLRRETVAPKRISEGWIYRVAEVGKRAAQIGQPVYDLEVAHSHAFLTFGATLHNCDGLRKTYQFGIDLCWLVSRNREGKLHGVAQAGPFVASNAAPSSWVKPVPELAGTMLDGEMHWPGHGAAEAGSAYSKDSPELEYCVFDCLYFMGQDVRKLPYEQRYRLALDVVHVLCNPRIKLIKNLPATKEALKKLWDSGEEGGIFAKKDAAYGESGSRYKAKAAVSVDAFVIGMSEGKEGGSGVKGVKPKPNGKVATLTLALMKEGVPVEIGKARIPPAADLKAAGVEPPDLVDMWVNQAKYVGKVCEVTASGFDGRTARWLRFKQWREDKQKENCQWSDQIGK
jgi:hypothetical protein